MNKIKKLLNPLDIPYGVQDEILQVLNNDNFIGGLGEEDFVTAIQLDGKIINYQLRLKDIEDRNDFFIEVKNDISNAKAVFIMIEVLEDEEFKNYEEMIEDITSTIEDESTLLVDYKTVSNISCEPISIMLFGYEDNSVFSLEVGNNFAEYWSSNSSYCLEEFKKMKEKVSKELKKEINTIRIRSHSRSPNIIELVDAQNFQALRAFEFNEQTKNEFIDFLKKLEKILKNYTSN